MCPDHEAESDREAHELGRQAGERDRENNERGEKGRVTGEDSRVSAEQSRVTAEDARVEEAHQPLWVPRTKKATVYGLLICLLLGSIPGGMTAYIFAERGLLSAKEQRLEFCERIKADRIDNARAWAQAQTTWLERAGDNRLGMVGQAVAADAARVSGNSADTLRTRIYECGPLIDENRQVVDVKGLRESQVAP